MAMKRSATRAFQYLYPVELVWKALMGGDSRKVDPMPDADFDASEPAPNTMIFKAMDVVNNELFSFKMKTTMFVSEMRIELTAIGPCKTQMKATQSVEYRKVSAFIGSGFGSSLPAELSAFAKEIEKRLEAENKAK